MVISARVKEITLESGENEIKFDRTYLGFEVKNNSGSDVIMSLIPGRVVGDDGVVTIPNGESYNYLHLEHRDTFYLTGSGSVTVAGTSAPGSNFNSSQKGGETVDITSIAENHNAIFRGDDLFAKGYDINDICAMIADGSFSDIYIGDYFTLSGSIPDVPCFVEQIGDDGAKSLVESTQTVNYNTKFRIAGLDTYLNTGATAFTRHHVVIVPDNIIGSNRMNSANTTTGGYVGSFMFTSVLPVYNTHFSAKLNNHLLTHREILSNSVTGNQASGWTWTDVKINLMSEAETYGCIQWGSKRDVGLNYRQYPLFEIAPKYICNRDWYWIRAVTMATNFAGVSGGGAATDSIASNAGGIRPCFCIG